MTRNTLISDDYVNGFRYDENGTPISFRSFPITEWAECEKLGRYPVRYGDDVSSWPIQCGCLACLAEEKLQQKIDAALIPPRFADKSFENFSCEHVWQRDAKELVESYAYDFDKTSRLGRSLVILGRPGTGKTHLACAYANEILRQGHTALFTSVARIIRKVRASWTKGNEEEVLSAYTGVDLLIVDEVGVQAGTENEKQIIFNVLNERYNNVLPTVLISNLRQNEVQTYLGERVWDRLKEGGGNVLILNGESQRR